MLKLKLKERLKFPYFFCLGWGIFWLINFFLLTTPKSLGNESNFSNLTFETLAPLEKGGTSKFPTGEVRTWKAGQSVSDILNLGDFRFSSRFHQLTLADIRALNKTKISYTLANFGYLKKINLRQLVRDIEGLQNLKISQLPLVQSLLKAEGYDFSRITQSRLGALLKAYPQLGDLSFKKVNLNQYPLTSIPELMNIPLMKLTGWETLKLKEVPGLTKIPLSVLASKERQHLALNEPPILMSGIKMANFSAPGFAILDLVLTTVERPATRSMSGGYNVGFGVSCSKNCAHIEVVGNYQFNGKQWIDGRYQNVDGGSGCLKPVNGGVEPTGRHPYGSVFKVVVLNTDELTDTAQFTAFLRMCNLCGCTPYFMGPALIDTHKTGDSIFVGF
ncbi:conserved hypothetical protein (plasmid) [Gloeothece citriformis PCC 7424]|uniref:Uncharacterized protein n=1 Tax=Gloeothece citriformis (strain PCC 7424) TaxID=65393 RepID=B7KLU1_GLOC7|nr:hypothetical protein [Gloeothece citriformis]ACK73763.1 conserved hypothetical protein [Gloeothece citriformis PCC 7424]ACK74029.1 conserved hypothetical protein [Gloeothece citriformis PCC 7424]